MLGIGDHALAFFAADKDDRTVLPAVGTVEVVFTPGNNAAEIIVAAISQAKKQVLVQAFSFTHKGIANALIAVHKRGIEVKIIADREQTERIQGSKVTMMARAGVPVWLDGDHQSAHNKSIMIDTGLATAVLVTGSFNFTNAAQHRNAENVLLLRGNEKLVRLYSDNWSAHLVHAKPYRAP